VTETTDARDLLFRRAHTPYAFTDEPVTDAQLAEILELAQLGPTAFNAQPMRVLALRSGEGRDRLVPLMAPGNRAKTAQAPLTLVLAADLDFHEELPRVNPAAAGARDTVFADAEVRRSTALLNTGMQIGYLVMAIRTVGLGAGPMTGFDRDAIDAEFFPEGDHHTLVVINVGRPDADSYRPRNPRVDREELLTVL